MNALTQPHERSIAPRAVVALVQLALGWSLSIPCDAWSRTAALKDAIAELRASGRYEAALDSTRVLARELEGVSAGERRALQRRLERLEWIIGLDDATRTQVARADSLAALGSIAYARGHYDEAERLARVRLQQLAVLGDDHPDSAPAMLELGATLWKLGRLRDADAWVERAATILGDSAGRDSPEFGEARNLHGLVRMAMGDLKRSETLYQQSLATARRVYTAPHPAIAAVLSNLGAVALERGEPVASERYYREALATQRQIEDESALVAKLTHNLAFALNAQHDYVRAEPLFREALAMRRRTLPADHPDIAVTLHMIALIDRMNGHYDAARQRLEEALAIRRARLGESHVWVAWNIRALGSLAGETGDLETAERLTRESLDIVLRAHGENHPETVRALSAVAGVLIMQQRWDEAESCVQRARAIEARTQLLPAFGLPFASGLIALARGRFDSAVPHLNEAAQLAHESRHRLASTETRAEVLPGVVDHALSVSLLNTGDGVGAWQAAERARGRVLADLLFAARPDAMSQEEIEQPRDLDQVQRALPARAALIGWVDLTLPHTEPQAWGYVLRKDQPVRWVRLPHATASHATSTASQHHLWFDRSHAMIAESGTGDDVTARFRNKLVAAGGWPLRVHPSAALDTLGHRVWRERIAPIATHLTGIDRLIVVPCGPMLGIPIETLIDDRGQSLVDHFTISYAPSGGLLAWLIGQRGSDEPQRQGCLLVGAPELTVDPAHPGPTSLAVTSSHSSSATGAGSAAMPAEHRFALALAGDARALAALPELPMAAHELEQAAAHWPGATTLMAADANKAALAQLVANERFADFDVLHFATHVLIDDRRPERSAIVLSRPAAQDGLVRASDIIRAWKLDASLVVLSGCQSALGRETGGEGYIGLAHAFFQAGARSLLVSLWPVDDRATALLMERFYANMTAWRAGSSAASGPGDRANALAAAKRWLREWTAEDGSTPYAHPAYWAPFVLIGDSGPGR